MEARLSVAARIWGTVVSVGLLAAVVTPVTWETGRDSFPRSSYPMFARKEVSAVVNLHYAIGLDANDERYTLRPELVANGEVLQARAALSHAVRSGKRAAALCEHIAAGVAEDDSLRRVERVRLVTGTHDAVEFLRHGTLGRERARVECEVSR